MATLILRRAICYSISALTPSDNASMSLIEMDGFILLNVVYDGF
jgi:hypothetical protein